MFSFKELKSIRAKIAVLFLKPCPIHNSSVPFCPTVLKEYKIFFSHENKILIEKRTKSVSPKRHVCGQASVARATGGIYVVALIK
jgi:hypothetical protein